MLYRKWRLLKFVKGNSTNGTARVYQAKTARENTLKLISNAA